MGELVPTLSCHLGFLCPCVITMGMFKVTSSYVLIRWSGTDCSSDVTSRDSNRRGSFLSPSSSSSSPLALSSSEISAKAKRKVTKGKGVPEKIANSLHPNYQNQ